MNTQEMTLEQIRVVGMEALARELGPTGLIRFLQMFEKGQGNYTEEREEILPPLTATEIAERIGQRRNK
ncbi:MAG: hypothetical protein MOB07_21760 [Acidobacteria bacterium]|nr:hypothetical protein [Acidobacteriota bacterium]